MDYGKYYGSSRSACYVLRREGPLTQVIYANGTGMALARCSVLPAPVQVCLGELPQDFFQWLNGALLRPGVDGWTLLYGQYHKEYSFSLIPLEDGNRLLTVSCDSLAVDTLRQALDFSRKELQAAVQEAQEANAAKSRFLSNMSHDIRTPMNAIIGMTDIALAHTDSPERMVDCLYKIRQASGHLLSLINNVLDMSRIESGKVELHKENFELGHLLGEMRTILRPSAANKGLRFSIDCPDICHEEFRGDEIRIQQILINFAGNSIKFTQNGSVSITVREECSPWLDESVLHFTVADTGIGMDEEFQKKLFTPFERADAAWAQHIEGTGLGMSIAKQLTEMMNGHIEVASKPGVGTRIEVSIPLEPVQPTGTHEMLLYIGQGVLLWNRIGLCPEMEDFLAQEGLFCQVESSPMQLLAAAKRMEAQENLWGMIVDADEAEDKLTQQLNQFKAVLGEDFPVVVLTKAEDLAHFPGADGVLHWPLYRTECRKLLVQLSRKQGTEHLGPLVSGQNPLRDFTQKHLLLVEDNPLNMEIATEFLKETGVQIDTASNGQEAVEKFTASDIGYYSLIFMDIQMPVMDGLEASRRIRSLSRPDAKSVGIVAMSANAFAEDVRRSLQAGMNQHLSKPLELDKVYEVMDKWLV